ncbi:MAG: T9SS type A sorting domain-containing protein [Flavobacteriaceae bacterium]|nr:T9SS type A sorting domain-containing protein [Flavobacteriaceae bacterium]
MRKLVHLCFILVAFPLFSQTTYSLVNNDGIHRLANRCYEIKYHANGVLGKSFKVDGASGLFYLKPAGLGEFIFYNDNKQLLAIDGDRIVLTDRLSEDVIWKLRRNKESMLVLQHKVTGEYIYEWYFISPYWFPTLKLTKDVNKAIHIGYASSDSCQEFPEAKLNLTGKILKTEFSDGSVYGIADVHNHAASHNMVHGLINAGKMFSPLGIQDALKDCATTHGNGGHLDPLGALSRTGGDGQHAIDFDSVIAEMAKGHDTGGFPTFKDWPKFNEATHQMNYYKWLDRARMGGLRLMTVYTVDNIAASILMNIVFDKTGPYLYPREGTPNPRDSQFSGTEVSNVSLKFMYDLQDYVDAQEGGVGKGWLRIVKSPEEARTVIKQGKLAIVLGLELADLMDCIDGAKNRPKCTKEYIEQKIQFHYEQGVRAIFPALHYNNDFVGTNKGGFVYEFGQAIFNGELDQYELCKKEGKFGAKRPAFDLEAYKELSGFGKGIIGEIVRAITPIDLATIPDLPEVTEELQYYCNSVGLKPKGKLLMHALMSKGIMIDIDHVSKKAVKEIKEVLDPYGYPYIVTHNDDVAIVGEAVFSRGGLLAQITTKSNENGSKCKFPTSEDAFLNNKLISEASLKYKNIAATTLSTDFFGSLNALGPRFNNAVNACKKNQGNRMQYPFTSFDGGVVFEKQQSGDRTFDFNTDGFAHYGLLPDLIEDFKALGKSDKDIETWYRGAEAYLRTWENAIQAQKKHNATHKSAVIAYGKERTLEKTSLLSKPAIKTASTTKEIRVNNLPNPIEKTIRLKLYPTFVDDSFKVKSETPYVLTVLLFNVYGELVYEQTFSRGEEINVNKLSHLAKGVYIVNIRDAKGELNRSYRIVKK